MRKPLSLVATAIVLAVVLVSCGLSTNDAPKPIAKENVPTDLQDENSSATTLPDSGGDSEVVQIWLLQTGNDVTLLRPVDRVVPWPANAKRVLDALLDQGPTDAERAAGFSTAIPTDARLASQPEQVDDVLNVSLSDSTYTGLSGANASNAFAQIVFTVTQLDGIDFVQFWLEGKPVAVPDGLGEQKIQPLDRTDYANLVR